MDLNEQVNDYLTKEDDYFKAMDLNDTEQLANDYFTKDNDYFIKDLNKQEDEFDDYFANTIDFNNSIYVL